MIDDIVVCVIGKWDESAPPDPRRTAWAGLPVSITGIAREVSGPFDMYLTWAAWTACRFDEMSWDEARHLCEQFNQAVNRHAPNPVFQFRAEPTAVELEAAFGPDGKGGTCVRLALPGEPAWFAPLFRPNRLTLLESAREYLRPWAQCAVVGRHLVGDWGTVWSGWLVRGDDNFHHGRVVESVLDVPDLSSLTAVVTTDPTRAETTVEALTTPPLVLTTFQLPAPGG